MKEWLKNHALELISLVVAIAGVKGLADFWTRLCEMFGGYAVETLLVCGLSAYLAAVISVFVSRRVMRIRLAAKDAEHERAIAEKDAEIAKLRRNIVGLEDVDAVMRYLPDNLSRLVDEIYEEGGSVRCPHDSDLNELLSRRVIKRSSDGSGLLTWSLAPGVVKYIKEKEREDG